MDNQFVNSKNAFGQEKIDELERIAKNKFCPFCDPNYIKNEHKKPILKKGKYWLATENRWPYKGTRAHLIFIHKKHLSHLDELGVEDWQELKEIVKEMTDKFSLDGAALAIRFGNSKYTGATVTHLHAQLISGKGDSNEPVMFRLG